MSFLWDTVYINRMKIAVLNAVIDYTAQLPGTNMKQFDSNHMDDSIVINSQRKNNINLTL